MCFYAGAYVGFKARMAGDKELVANQEVENPALQRSATQKLMQSATENPTKTCYASSLGFDDSAVGRIEDAFSCRRSD